MRRSSFRSPLSGALALLMLVACTHDGASEIEADGSVQKGAEAGPGADGDAGGDPAAAPFKGQPADAAAADAGPAACDPLAAKAQPIALATVTAVGQATDGTLYVAASIQGKDAADIQVFVSSDGTLQRQRELGSGSSGDADADLTISFERDPTPNRLVIKRRGGIIVGIALGNDQDRTSYDNLSSAATQLTVVAPSRIDGMPVRNLPGETVLEYATHVSDGSQLVVTRPRDDWTDKSVRVFYGRAPTLTERAFGPVGFSRGSSTWLNFEVDGADYTAVLTSSLSAPGPSTLTTPTGMLTITQDDTTMGLPAGLTFLCLQ